MIIKLTLLYCIGFAAARSQVKTLNAPPLKWATKHSLEATKYYMTSGVVENFKYWRTPTNSRLEANEGAVIKIVVGTKYGKGKYEIHPETTEEVTNKIVCTKQTSISVSPEDFLPNVRDLHEQGTENVRGIDCVKFTNTGKPRPAYEKTLWAYYSNDTESWIPIRYKTKEVDEWHGYLNNYEMYDYSNYKDNVELDVFKITYNCTTNKKDKKSLTKSNADYHLNLNPEEMKTFVEAFSAYKRRFGKQYANKEEHEIRKRNFYKSWRLVTSTNSKNLGYKLALNKLSDRIDEEINKYKVSNSGKPRKPGNIPFPYSENEIKKVAATLPKNYDLRVEGLVGPVLNKLSEGCTSTWAFAVTAAVEGAIARSNGGTWMKLSEQALIDCSWGYGNKGCQGGSITNSYSWIVKNGIPLQQSYGAYTNKNGFCKMENMTKTYTIKGYTDVTPNSIGALKIALINHGPVSVNVIVGYGLMVYDGGILYDEYCDNNKGEEKIPMTVVGYGERDGDTFWVLKDSKGPYWGVDGYVYMSAKNNNCGVMNEATYAVA